MGRLPGADFSILLKKVAAPAGVCSTALTSWLARRPAALESCRVAGMSSFSTGEASSCCVKGWGAAFCACTPGG